MIWIISIVIDALPNTYHQPIGPATDFGTGCVNIGHRLVPRHKRASSQEPIARSVQLMRYSSHPTKCLARSGSEELESPAGRLRRATCSERGRAAADPMPALHWRSKRLRGKGRERGPTAETKTQDSPGGRN